MEDPKFHPENAPKNADRLPSGKARGATSLDDDSPFSDLDGEYREKFYEASTEAIRKEAGQVAFNEVANQVLKSEDKQLEEANRAFKAAGAQYKEATKANKLKMAFLRSILEDRGEELAPRDMGLQSAT